MCLRVIAFTINCVKYIGGMHTRERTGVHYTLALRQGPIDRLQYPGFHALLVMARCLVSRQRPGHGLQQLAVVYVCLPKPQRCNTYTSLATHYGTSQHDRLQTTAKTFVHIQPNPIRLSESECCSITSAG